MPTVRYKEFKKDTNFSKMEIRRFYETKYYGLFLNAYEFKGITTEESHYLLKRMWKDGTINAYILEGSKSPATLENILSQKTINNIGQLILTPYAISQWNILDFPSVITPINVRGATFIKSKPMIVNKDCVIGYAHVSHSPIRDLVMFYIDKIVDVEITINTNLFVHKLPRLIVVSPEDRKRVDDIVESIENGEHKLFLDAEDYQAIKNVLDSGGNYIIDKLYQYKQSLENELLTFLGIDNIGMEKRERLIVDEANSNNDIINDSSDCFLDSLKAFCKNVSEILKYPLSVEAKSSPVSAIKESEIIEGGEQHEND